MMQHKPTGRGAVLCPEFGTSTLDIRDVGGRVEANASEKTRRRSSEKAVAPSIEEI